MKKYILTPIFTALLAHVAMAQMPMSLYYMENIPQTATLNVAHQPRCNGYVALPGGTSFQLETNLILKELLQEKNGKWYTPIEQEFNYSDINKRFKKGLRLRPEANVTLLGIGWRSGNGYWTISINERLQANIGLPNAIFDLLDDGLADGSILNFTHLRTNVKAFHEISAGYSHHITEQITIGGRFKYLSGIGAVKTDISKFQITTSRDQWQVEFDGDIHASVPVLAIYEKEDGTAKLDSIETEDLKTKDIVNLLIPFVHNPGAAIDLGFDYKINDNFSISAAVNDLGLIVWTNKLNSIHAKGSYKFDGLKLDLNNLKDVDYEEAFDEIRDSVENCMSPKLNTKSFTTMLNPSIYISGAYTPNHYLTIGLLSRTTILNNTATQDFDLSVNVNPYKCFSLMTGLDFNVKGHLAANFGWSVNMGPLQLYMLTDYVPITYRKIKSDDDSVVLPDNTADFNLAIGLNLIFGAKGYHNKPMINAYSDF